MSFTGTAKAEVAVQNGSTVSQSLSITENGLVQIEELFSAAQGTDADISIGLQLTTKLHYLMISFSGGGGQFKVNSGTTAVPMESGGSVQFIGKTSTPASPANIFLNGLSDGGSVNKLLKIVVQTLAVNTTVRVVAMYAP